MVWRVVGLGGLLLGNEGSLVSHRPLSMAGQSYLHSEVNIRLFTKLLRSQFPTEAMPAVVGNSILGNPG